MVLSYIYFNVQYSYTAVYIRRTYRLAETTALATLCRKSLKPEGARRKTFRTHRPHDREHTDKHFESTYAPAGTGL